MDNIRKSTVKASEYKLCEKEEDVTELVDMVTEAHEQLPKKSVEQKICEAITSQIRFYKSVNFSSKIDYKLFHLSHDKKNFTTEELKNNLIKILEFYQRDKETASKDNGPSTSNDVNKEERINNLKKKYTFNGTSPTKKRRVKDPFPGDDIVGKRISLKFKNTGATRHHFYKGIVMRSSSNADLEEYMEEDDEQYVGKMGFYTVRFDPPHDSELFCYPLENEWGGG